MLEAVFLKFVVEGKRIADVEVRPPYTWLVRWRGVTEEGVEVNEGVGVG